MFYNTLSLGYAEGASPLANATQPVLDLAKLTCRMWISFINDLDPNGHGSKHTHTHIYKSLRAQLGPHTDFFSLCSI